MATGIEEQKPKSRLRVRIEDPGKIDLVELRRRLKKATDTVPPVEPEPSPIVLEPPPSQPPKPVVPVVTEPKAPFPWRWVAVGTGILVLLVGFVWVLMSTISSWQSKASVTKVEPKEPPKEAEPSKPEPKEPVPVPVVPKQPKVYEPIEVSLQLKDLAAAGDLEALFLIGCIHAEKSAHPSTDRSSSIIRAWRHAEEMTSYWKRAAEGGHPLAHFNLGVASRFGVGVMEDDNQAVIKFKAAQAAGLQDALALAPEISQDAPEFTSNIPRTSTPPNRLVQFGLGTMFAIILGVLLNRYRARKLAQPEIIGSTSVESAGGGIAPFGYITQFVSRYGFIMFMGAWIGMIFTQEGYIWGWVVESGDQYYDSEPPWHWLSYSIIRTVLFGLPLAAFFVVLMDRLGVNLLAPLDYDSTPLPQQVSKKGHKRPQTFHFFVRKSSHIIIFGTLLWQYILLPGMDLDWFWGLVVVGIGLAFFGAVDMDPLPQLNLKPPLDYRPAGPHEKSPLPQFVQQLPLAILAFFLLVPIVGVPIAIIFVVIVFSLKDVNPIARLTGLTFCAVPIAEGQGKPLFRRRLFPEYLLKDNVMPCIYFGFGLVGFWALIFLLQSDSEGMHPGMGLGEDMVGFALSLVVSSVGAAIFIGFMLHYLKLKEMFRKLPQIVGFSWVLICGLFLLVNWLPAWTDYSMKQESKFVFGLMVAGGIFLLTLIKADWHWKSLKLLPGLDIDSYVLKVASPMTLLLRRKSRLILLLGSLIGMLTVLPVHEAAGASVFVVWFWFSIVVGIPLAALGALIQRSYGAQVLGAPETSAELKRGWVLSRDKLFDSLYGGDTPLIIRIMPVLLWVVALVLARVSLGDSIFTDKGNLFFSPYVFAMTIPLAFLFWWMVLENSEFLASLNFHPTLPVGVETEDVTQSFGKAPTPWVHHSSHGLVVRWKPLLGAAGAIIVISWFSAGMLVGLFTPSHRKVVASPENMPLRAAGLPTLPGNLSKLASFPTTGFLLPKEKKPLIRPHKDEEPEFQPMLPGLMGGNPGVQQIAFGPGNQMATLHGGKFLFVWDIKTRALKRMITHAYFPHVKKLWFAGSNQLQMKVDVDGKGKQVFFLMCNPRTGVIRENRSYVTPMAFSRRGRMEVAAGVVVEDRNYIVGYRRDGDLKKLALYVNPLKSQKEPLCSFFSPHLENEYPRILHFDMRGQRVLLGIFDKSKYVLWTLTDSKIKALEQQPRLTFETFFDFLDKNNDEQLSEAEFSHLILDVRQFDFNNNGFVERNEYANARYVFLNGVNLTLEAGVNDLIRTVKRRGEIGAVFNGVIGLDREHVEKMRDAVWAEPGVLMFTSGGSIYRWDLNPLTMGIQSEPQLFPHSFKGASIGKLVVSHDKRWMGYWKENSANPPVLQSIDSGKSGLIDVTLKTRGKTVTQLTFLSSAPDWPPAKQVAVGLADGSIHLESFSE